MPGVARARLPLQSTLRDIATDANGGITVTAQGIDKDNIDGKFVTLFPADDKGKKLTYTQGVTINRWICGGDGYHCSG